MKEVVKLELEKISQTRGWNPPRGAKGWDGVCVLILYGLRWFIIVLFKAKIQNNFLFKAGKIKAWNYNHKHG